MKKQIKDLTKGVALITYLESLKDMEEKLEKGEFDPRRVMLVLVKSFIKIIERAVEKEKQKKDKSEKEKKKTMRLYS